jgi:copper transport protein
VLVGGAAALRFAWRDGWTRPGVRRLLWASWALLFLSTVMGVLVEGVHDLGLSLRWLADGSLIAFVLGTRFGEASVATAALLAVAAALLNALSSWEPAEGWKPATPRWWTPVGIAAGVGLLVCAAVSGDAASGRWVVLGTVVATVHLGSAAVWIGGLSLLGLALWKGADPAEAAPVVLSVSNLAFWGVVLVVASGVVQSARQLGGIGALTDTTFGRILLAKVLLAAALVVLGALSRRIVHGHLVFPEIRRRSSGQRAVGSLPAASFGSAAVLRGLRVSVAAELLVAAAVVGTTAGLVTAIPPQVAAAPVAAAPGAHLVAPPWRAPA